jgi:hypothetical protein
MRGVVELRYWLLATGYWLLSLWKQELMILLQSLIHQIYFLLSAVIAVLLLTRLFRRKTRPGLAYDIVYAYTIIPFILRALHIK